MKKIGLWIMLLFHLAAQAQHKFPIQAHRGARSHFPENSLYAFSQSVQAGFRMVELDVVISGDGKIVVSHDPWFNPNICGKNQQLLQQKIPLYQLTYEEIKTYDCGSFGHPHFPQQQKVSVHKPLLEEVLIWANQQEKEIGEQLVLNIEIKTKKSWEKKGMPFYTVVCDSVLSLLQKHQRSEKDILQSFDVRVLNYLYQKNPKLTLSYLVGNALGIKQQLGKLKFSPSMYSPHYRLVNAKIVKYAHQQGIKVIPWTVNQLSDFIKLYHLSVDGIISDDPQLLQNYLQENQK